MASGSAIESYARQNGIRLNTVRTHLKRIFTKTGVTRQADLIRLLLTEPPL